MSDEATIRRGARNARYTTLPNQVLEDVRLSMEARWLLSYLLSKPDNWIVRVADISKKGGCGRDKARRMVNELVELGYAEKEQNRGDEGKFGRLSLVVYDEPRPADESIRQAEAESVAFLPQTENPSTVQPSPANASLVKTDVLANPDSTLEREARASADGQGGEPAEAGEGRRDDPRRFEARVKRLAEGWPGWANSSTAWAVRQFAALTDAERAEAERCRAGYLAHCGGKALSVGTYLAERKWRDLPAAALAAADPSAQPHLAAPFGKLWGARRMALLVGTPPQPAPQASGFIATQLADPGEAGRRARLERQARFGWPAVNRMDELAAQAKPWPLAAVEAARLERLAAATEQVWTGTPLWDAWRDEFARRGWPWLPQMGQQRVASFPAGGPDGLEAFAAAVRASAAGREPDRATEGPASGASGAARRIGEKPAAGREPDRATEGPASGASGAARRIGEKPAAGREPDRATEGSASGASGAARRIGEKPAEGRPGTENRTEGEARKAS